MRRTRGLGRYGGGWGEARDNKETTGPQGPSRFKKPAPDGW
jgi:hypothetical protein